MNVRQPPAPSIKPCSLGRVGPRSCRPSMTARPSTRRRTSSCEHRGTSIIRSPLLLGPYRRPIPRVLGGSEGDGRFLMSEVALYTDVPHTSINAPRLLAVGDWGKLGRRVQDEGLSTNRWTSQTRPSICRAYFRWAAGESVVPRP